MSAVEVLPCSGCFITCIVAHFLEVELDYVIQFSTISRMLGFLWHSSKWAHCFGCLLQYTSGIEVSSCSIDNDLNYVTTMLQLHPPLNHYVFQCIFKDRYYAPQQHSFLDLRPSAEFSTESCGSYLFMLSLCV